MSTTGILYESLPMMRLGARIKDDEVVTAPDYSTAAYMLEEYLALATTRIAIPESAPEAKVVSQFPKLLQKRIVVFKDEQEKEAVSRILYPVMAELDIKERSSGLGLDFPSGMSHEVRAKFSVLRKSLFKLAVGFNHCLQVGVSPPVVRSLSRDLRSGLSQGDGRVILAQLEGLLAVYADVEFESPLPPAASPPELVSLFDRLLNDPSYLELSRSVADLGDPKKRTATLSQIREWGRNLLRNTLLTNGWNYGGKVIKAWTGAPVPEAERVLAIFTGREFPVLVDLRDARKRAVRKWAQSLESTQPISALGNNYKGVAWIVTGYPPEDWDGGDFSFHSLGTVAKLKVALEQYAQQD